MGKQVSLTVRVDDELFRQFGALLVIKGLSTQDFLRSRIDVFVKENQKYLNVNEIKKDIKDKS
jgi:hypothetical protein